MQGLTARAKMGGIDSIFAGGVDFVARIAGGDGFDAEVVSEIYGVVQIMYFKRWEVTLAVLVGLGAIGIGFAIGQSPGVARRTAPTASGPSTARLSPQAALVYNYVKMQMPGELKWQRTPWMVDLPEAVRQAKAENRPLFIWATDDDPLERC